MLLTLNMYLKYSFTFSRLDIITELPPFKEFDTTEIEENITVGLSYDHFFGGL